MRSIMSRTRRSAMVAGLGAAAAYYFDPDNGEFRRRDIAARVRQVFDRTPWTWTPSDGGAPVTDPLPQDDGAQRAADPTGGGIPIEPDALESWTTGPAIGAPTPVVLP